MGVNIHAPSNAFRDVYATSFLFCFLGSREGANKDHDIENAERGAGGISVMSECSILEKDESFWRVSHARRAHAVEPVKSGNAGH